MTSPHLPIDRQDVDDDLPEVLLDEDGEPVVDSDDDEDRYDKDTGFDTMATSFDDM